MAMCWSSQPRASVRKGDRVVVKTVSGEVMAKVLKSRTRAEPSSCVSLNPEHPDRQLRPLTWNGWRASSGRASRRRCARPFLHSCLILAAFANFLGGRLLDPGAPEAGSAEGDASQPVQVVTVETPAPGWRLATAPIPDRAPDAARVIAPAIVAPPALDPSELKWTEPRAPLSELAQARPPRPKPPGNTVFRPLAVESALVQATGGGHVEIAGTVSLPAEETCDFEGTIWACGLARPNRIPRCGFAAGRSTATCRPIRAA